MVLQLDLLINFNTAYSFVTLQRHFKITLSLSFAVQGFSPTQTHYTNQSNQERWDKWRNTPRHTSVPTNRCSWPHLTLQTVIIYHVRFKSPLNGITKWNAFIILISYKFQRMLAIIQSRISWLPILYHKNQTLKYTKLKFCHFCWIGTKPGLSFSGRNIDWGCLRTALRKIFGPQREEDRSWGKLHNNELHGLQSSPNFVTVIISRRKRWAEHVAHMGEGRGV
jgi:hypothetical protein